MKAYNKKYRPIHLLLLVFYVVSLLVAPMTHHHHNDEILLESEDVTLSSSEKCECNHESIFTEAHHEGDHNNHLFCSQNYFITNKVLIKNFKKTISVDRRLVPIIIEDNEYRSASKWSDIGHSIKIKSNEYICHITNVSPPLV
ncbi:MAG: hypothetical protein JEY94_06260 [Melioribacteraceae bacterium]|nr:hypothetical protein [Melioribacteraceae bacterium]